MRVSHKIGSQVTKVETKIILIIESKKIQVS